MTEPGWRMQPNESSCVWIPWIWIQLFLCKIIFLRVSIAKQCSNTKIGSWRTCCHCSRPAKCHLGFWNGWDIVVQNLLLWMEVPTNEKILFVVLILDSLIYLCSSNRVMRWAEMWQVTGSFVVQRKSYPCRYVPALQKSVGCNRTVVSPRTVFTKSFHLWSAVRWGEKTKLLAH